MFSLLWKKDESVKKLFKLQWMIMMSPITVAVVIGASFFCLMGDVAIAWEGRTTSYHLVRTYQVTTTMINRVIITLASVMLATHTMIPKYDHHVILLVPIIKRTSLFYSKWLIFFLIISSFIFFMMAGQTIVGLLMIHQYYLSITCWLEWTQTFFCGMMYALYTMLLTQLTRSSMVALGPMMVFVATSNLTFHGISEVIAFGLFVVGEVHLDGSILYLLWMMVLMVLLNAWIYQKKDFSY